MNSVLAVKLIPAIAFFGYAGVANLTLLVAPDVRLPGFSGVLTGEVTQEIDSLYRENLPHKDPAVGLIGAARYVLLDEGRDGVMVGADGHLFTVEEFRPIPAAQTTYASALGEIEAASTHLAGLGVPLVVAPLPAKLDLLRDKGPDPHMAAELETFYTAFLVDLSAMGVAAVDTRPAMLALDDPFLATDTHWSPDGARAVAATIADSAIIPAGDIAFTIEQDPQKSFAGDLVSYVTSDHLAPSIGLAFETVAPYRAVVTDAAGGDGAVLDLFGTAGPTGADLVGTSYSANPNWSFPEALKLELSLDVINHAKEGQGPFTPMRSYLAQLDPGALPQVVVWEIPVRYLTDPAVLPGEGT